MALAVPKLDDRQFQDIVDEARKRIPHYCKEWTDHNLSDPGVTLIELFAWMTDVILYRLNQVPDLHYIKFMQMLGITLHEPVPARVPVTFWLSAAQPTPVVIPAGTEVASTQTETEPSIIFTTDRDLQVQLPQLAVVTSRVTSSGDQKERYRNQNLRRLQAGFAGFEVFSPLPQAPQVDDALCFGFENDLSHHVLCFEMDFDPAGGAGVVPSMPPYVWEASTGGERAGWQPCDVEEDTTQAMNTAGRVEIHLPQMGKCDVNKNELYWVRVRNRAISPAEQAEGMKAYEESPRLRQASVACVGGTVPATHAQPVGKEFLGQSDGSPGQRFQLEFTPILKRQPGETLLVQVDGEPQQLWEEVADFANSGADDRHYTLDSVSGELRLGPAVRQPDGTIRLYGAIPPRQADLIFARYRYGGGHGGNVQAGILNTLKTALPYIARVSNRQAAWGGLDAESLESAMMRAPALLRSRDRAVTEEDFEFLARQALPAAVGRVKCVQPRAAGARSVAPGEVYVLVIPRVPRAEGFIERKWLQLRDEDIAALTAYLDGRRLLTTRVDIRAPAYHWIAVKVTLRAARGTDQAEVERQVLARLYRFLNPLTGGPNGTGWPFGRDLFVSDVYQSLQGAPNVQFIRSVEMYKAGPTSEPQGEAVESVDVFENGVIASGLHSVIFV